MVSFFFAFTFGVDLDFFHFALEMRFSFYCWNFLLQSIFVLKSFTFTVASYTIIISITFSVDAKERYMNNVSNELNLPDVEIDSKELIDGVLHYEVTLLEEEQHSCPSCRSSQISKNGHAKRKLKDAPLYDTPIVLHVRSQRYLCAKCRQSFCSPILFADYKNRVTCRLKKQVENRCLRRSVTELSEEYNVSVATISRITKCYVERLEGSWTNYTPEILALVNITLGKSTRVLCVDAKRNGVVDLFEKSDKASLIAALKNRFNFDEIDVVVIDFNRSHCDALKSIGNFFSIVIDKKYVLAKVVAAVRAELKGTPSSLVSLILKNPASLSELESNRLDDALKNDPHADRIANIKNLFFDMYNRNTSTEAEAVFEDIVYFVRKKDVYLYDLVQLVEEFHPEIFNFFDFNYSFSSVKDAENLVKKIEKKGAGFGYKNLRARLLFSSSARQATKTVTKYSSVSYKNNTFGYFTGYRDSSFSHPEIYEQFIGNYADIEMLLEAWDDE